MPARRWQRELDWSKTMARIAGSLTDLGKRFVVSVSESPQRIAIDTFWTSAFSLDDEAQDLFRGVYAIAYFASDGSLLGLYIGQSVDMHERAVQHAASLALDVDVLFDTSLRYREGRKAYSRRMCALAVFQDDDDAFHIGAAEQAFCWMSGPYRLDQELLEARKDAGLRVVPGKGLNCES